MHNHDIVRDKTNALQSKICSALKWAHAFWRKKLFTRKRTYVNPFDAVSEAQARLRREANGYSFFINADLVTVEELKSLYRWFNVDGETKDKEGKIRIMILRKLPDSVLQEVVDPEKPRYQPSCLRYEIEKRIKQT